MLCDDCGRREAVVHITQIGPDGRTEKNLCEECAAGYGDFCDQLQGNDYGLAFDLRLFPAVMQGANVEESVLAAEQAARYLAGVTVVKVIVVPGKIVNIVVRPQ